MFSKTHSPTSHFQGSAAVSFAICELQNRGIPAMPADLVGGDLTVTRSDGVVLPVEVKSTWRNVKKPWVNFGGMENKVHTPWFILMDFKGRNLRVLSNRAVKDRMKLHWRPILRMQVSEFNRVQEESDWCVFKGALGY